MIRLLAGWQNGDGTIEWDDFRTIADDWYRGGELLGYMVYTEQFAGNLEGVREHLEYLRELGVNYLHLMPLLESPEEKSDGGYAVSEICTESPQGCTRTGSKPSRESGRRKFPLITVITGRCIISECSGLKTFLRTL